MSRRHRWTLTGGYSMRCAVCGARRRTVAGSVIGQSWRIAVNVYQPSGSAGWLVHYRPCGSTLAEWFEGNDPC